MRSRSWHAAEYPALYARFEVFLEDLYSVVRLSAAAKDDEYCESLRKGRKKKATIPLKLLVKSASALARPEFGREFARMFMFRDSMVV